MLRRWRIMLNDGTTVTVLLGYRMPQTVTRLFEIQLRATQGRVISESFTDLDYSFFGLDKSTLLL